MLPSLPAPMPFPVPVHGLSRLPVKAHALPVQAPLRRRSTLNLQGNLCMLGMLLGLGNSNSTTLFHLAVSRRAAC